MTDVYLTIAVIAAVTVILRFLPFLIFGGKKKTPRTVKRLGKLLPFAIMGMLVIYCLKDISIITYPYGLPELIACIAVALLHIWRKNTILSIGGGTVIYMLLIQLVF